MKPTHITILSALGIVGFTVFMVSLVQCQMHENSLNARAYDHSLQHPSHHTYLTCEEHCAESCRPHAVKRMQCHGWSADVCECAP
jgi:hypothetical protein